MPGAEWLIGLSVVVLGVLMAAKLRAPTLLAMAVVAVFAVAHGHVQGSEMPASAAGLV